MSERERRERVERKPRGQYHHGELRRALIGATLAIVEEGGTGAVSLSAAARRVGVSPQATYNHFRDKSELLAVIAEETVRALAAAMRQASTDSLRPRPSASGGADQRATRPSCARPVGTKGSSKPGDAFEAIGITYVGYACEHAAQFRLLSAPELADKSGFPDLSEAYEAAFGVLLETIENCQKNGCVRKTDARKLARTAWATVHGLAWLNIDGQLAISGETKALEVVARDSLRALFKGFEQR